MKPLYNILPAKVRMYVYAVLALAALVWGVYQASGGDWRSFVGALIVTLVNSTAAANTADPAPAVDTPAK